MIPPLFTEHLSLRTIAISGLVLVSAARGSVIAQELASDSARPGVASDQSPGGPFGEAALVPKPPADSSASSGWYAGIASGWYFPIQAWPTTYQLGGGGMFLLGDQLNRHWAVQLDLNMWLFSGNGRDTWDLKTGPVILWTPSDRRLAPFLLAGAGVDFQTNYPEQVSRLAPMMTVGAGVRFAMGVRNSFFVETRHYFVLRSVTTRDIPVLTGFRLGF
jgi:hypothetical protein